MILACQITFGLAENAEEFQLEGWSDSRQSGITYALRPPQHATYGPAHLALLGSIRLRPAAHPRD